MERYVAGQSIREISREEGRARETTTKIVRSDQMQTFVLRMREQFYGLAYDALEAVQHALRQEKDGHLGYRFLTDIGVVPSKEERQTLTAHPVAAQKSEAEGVFEILKQMEEAAKERAELFGMSMPEKVVFEDVCRWLFETTGGIEPLIGFSEQTTENG